MTTPPWEEMAHLVTELAVHTTDGQHDGPPLLTQLRRAVWGNLGGTMAGAGGNGLPINIGAHLLLEDLVLEIEGAFSGVTGFRGSKSVVGNLLGWHCTFGMLIGQGRIDEHMQEVALDKLRGWAQRIRDQFDAPLLVPLRDFQCPTCGEGRAVWMDRDLVMSGSAIVITLTGKGELVATCRNVSCGHRWHGDVDVLYMARSAGIDVDALAAEIRIARQPVTTEYVEPEGRRFEDFDPSNPDHAALLRGEA